MKRMSYLVMALLLTLSLSACATIHRYAPAESAEPSATDTQETAQPEEKAQPEVSGEPARPAAQTGVGNLAGNLNNEGRIIEDENGVVYLAQKDGIYQIQNGDSKRICEDRAVDLNLWNGRLYYVAQEYSADDYYDEHVGDTLVSIALDGSDRQELGEKRPVRVDSIWPEEPVDSMIYEANTYYCGYTDLNVINGQLYFIANNGNEGSADVTNYYGNSQGTIHWDSDKSLYRMELDGSNLTELVANIGSDDPHFCTDGEKLYYATSYTNCFFSYPFVAFYSCNLDGSGVQSLLDGMGGEKSFDCEKGVINEIVDGLFFENGKLYVSASDSEGDFPSTRLMRVDGGENYKQVGDELYGVHTLGDGAGGLIWFRSTEAGTKYVVDADGVYGDEYVDDAQLLRVPGDDVANAQVLMEFQHLVRWSEEFSYFNMALFGDHLYILTDRSLYCLNIRTGSEETLLTPVPDCDVNTPAANIPEFSEETLPTPALDNDPNEGMDAGN